MNPHKKVLFSFVSFFLVLVTIACSCGSLIPSGSGTPQNPPVGNTPSNPPGGGSTQNTKTPVVPGATATTLPQERAFIEQVSNQTDVPAGESGTISAACPPDSLMLSGGFASAEGIKITKTMPDPSGWLVTGQNGTTDTLPLTAYATCLHNASGTIDIVSVDVPVSGFPRAKCQDGALLTGGGYAFTADSLEVYLNTPDGEPTPIAWSVMAKNHQSEDQPISVYALCLSNSSLTGTLVRDLVTFVPGTNSLSFTMVCPSGAVMSAGGYEGTGAYISRVDLSDAASWIVQVTGKIYFDASLDHAVCLTLP